MGTVFNISPYFVGEFMTRLNSKRIMPAGDIYNHIKQAKKKATEDFCETNIDRNSVEELFNHLLHQGFIQPDGSGDYVCPIPSLRSWCLTKAGMEYPQEENPASQPSN